MLIGNPAAGDQHSSAKVNFSQSRKGWISYDSKSLNIIVAGPEKTGLPKTCNYNDILISSKDFHEVLFLNKGSVQNCSHHLAKT